MQILKGIFKILQSCSRRESVGREDKNYLGPFFDLLAIHLIDKM